MFILTILYVVVVVVLLFGAAIFIHEFGHYWMARKRGLKVEAFAIGFGPKIFGWTKDGIEYSWRWIPAGGFVKLPQMITSEAIEGAQKEEALPPVSPWSKILVAFAGPFMNILFALALATLLWVVGLPMPVNPPIIGYVEKGSPEEKMGILPGDRFLSVNGDPVRTWQDVVMGAALSTSSVIPVVIERDRQKIDFKLVATMDDEDAIRLKSFNLDVQSPVIVGRVDAGGVAEKAGVKEQDRIVSLAGVAIFSPRHLADIVNASTDKATDLVVERAGAPLQLNLIPKFDKELKRGRIGIAFAPPPVKYQVQQPGPTPWAQFADVWNKTLKTFKALAHSKETGVGAKDLSGPVGILAMLSAFVKTDFRLALSFLVLLNLNLAILNLLPVPVLDGGHIVMSLIEKICGRQINAKFQEYTTTAFAVMLISFMLYVTFFDIKRVPLFRPLFERETKIEQPARPPGENGGAPVLPK
jgi:regulator of sigma E protease